MQRRSFLTLAAATAASSALPLHAAESGLPLSAPRHIGRAGLRARDAEALALWYRRHVGLREIRREGAVIHLGAGDTVLLEITQREGLGIAPPQEAGLYHIAWLLPSRADLGRWLLTAAGARFPVDGAADHLVSEAFYLTDPEGNGVEIYADRPASTWEWSNGQVAMATDPVDFDGLAASAGMLPPFDLAPAGTCIGHVHLKVGEAAKAAAWWQGPMGFDAVRARQDAVFLSTGGYHHHVAVNEWQSAGAARRSERFTGLDWVEILTRDQTGPQSVMEDDWGTQFRLRQIG